MLSKLFRSGSIPSEKEDLQLMKSEIEKLKEEIQLLKNSHDESQVMMNILATANQSMASDLSIVYESLQKILGISSSPSTPGFSFTFRDEDDDLPN
jgi:FtsZ-binding cell division protein ZapB